MQTARSIHRRQPPDSTGAGPAQSSPQVQTACFHCGDPCPDANVTHGGQSFCCHGCRTVHELLTENGLGHFYELNRAPGVRMNRAVAAPAWAYLDAGGTQQRLLDFTDGQISKVTFHIPAIHCIACVWLLENLFRLHPGIGRSRVNFPRREVAITFSTQKVKLSELVAVLASIGYEPRLMLDALEKPQVDPAQRRLALQIGIAGFAFGNIMLTSLPLYLGLDSLSGPALRLAFGCLSLLLAAPVLVFSAADYWRAAWHSFRRRELTLDVPIALGLAALYAQSAFEILGARGAGYLDSLTGLVFFLLCGRAFQRKTYERLAFDRDYKAFFPLSALRKTAAGEETVALSELRVGDRLVLRNRELIPADGRLLRGPAFIDYSFVTGESELVPKIEGDYLYAGGQQTGGVIELEILKPVSHGYLTSLWNHEAFQKRRDDDLQSLTNRYSRRFTRIVIGVAVGAAVFWIWRGDAARGVKAFTSVLIVACPCALALAAPFALGTAQRLLARARIFLKSAHVLERLAKVDAIVFDKTGTLTAAGANAVEFRGAVNETVARRGQAVAPGIPTIEPRTSNAQRSVAAHSTAGESGPALTGNEARWVFSLTRHSTHPHAVRISDALAARNFPEPVRSFLETPGCGLEGQVQGHEIWLGSQAWLESRGVPVGQAACRSVGTDKASRAPNRQEAGPTPDAGPANGSVTHLAIDGVHRGAFAFSSVLRPEVDGLVGELTGQYAVALLSGDNERERERFLPLFGDSGRLRFNQSPLDKLGFIRRQQASGKTVMMVGDGLNDAGALKQSDVGVAVVERAGAFSPASDVILEAAQVPRLAAILRLARSATRVVRLGFGISAAYNLMGISIAAAGGLSPVICAVLMPLSSFTVVAVACGATAWRARAEGFSVDRNQGPVAESGA